MNVNNHLHLAPIIATLAIVETPKNLAGRAITNERLERQYPRRPSNPERFPIQALMESFLNHDALVEKRTINGEDCFKVRYQVKALRGKQTDDRMEIQGPSGDHAMRIAAQKSGKIVGQTIVPCNIYVRNALLQESIERSMRRDRVMSLE